MQQKQQTEVISMKEDKMANVRSLTRGTGGRSVVQYVAAVAMGFFLMTMLFGIKKGPGLNVDAVVNTVSQVREKEPPIGAELFKDQETEGGNQVAIHNILFYLSVCTYKLTKNPH